MEIISLRTNKGFMGCKNIYKENPKKYFGLGRKYADPVGPSAYIKFANALKRKLAPGGRLYYSVPCGQERLEFNAHRIFSPHTVLELFKELKLIELSGVLDDGKVYKTIDMELFLKLKTWVSTGFFEFTKHKNFT